MELLDFLDDLNSIFGDEASSRTSVYRWCGEFNLGHSSLKLPSNSHWNPMTSFYFCTEQTKRSPFFDRTISGESASTLDQRHANMYRSS